MTANVPPSPPSPPSPTLSAPKSHVAFIIDVWRPLMPWLLALIAITLLSTAVAVAYPLVLKLILDGLQAAIDQGGETDAVVRRGVLMLLVIALLKYGVNFYPSLRGYLNVRIERATRLAYFGHVLRKAESFFRRFRTGDLVTRLTDDIGEHPKVAWFCCSAIFRAVDSGSKLLFCLAVMTSLDLRLTLCALAPLPFIVLLFMVVERSLGRRVYAQRAAASTTVSLLETTFAAIPIIKAFNAEARRSAALSGQLEARVEREMAVVEMTQVFDAFHGSLNVVGQAIVIAVGGGLVLRGEMTIGTFYAFFTYLGMLMAPLFDLPNLFVTSKQAFVCMDRLEELRTADLGSEGGGFHGDATGGPLEHLELAGVDFGYGPDDVLAGLDLRVERGARVAIVGRLGSGKSTLLGLASGALVPRRGEIRWNGVPFARLDGSELRRHVAVVSQEPMLFSETLRDNVVFGRASDDDRLTQVLAAVGLTSEVAGFRYGVDEPLGQKGMTLSGGQRQRVAIARAIYGRPELLLLDDLTSALDADNEDRLWRSLRALLPTTTLVVVTHRTATARGMDRIVVLDGGRIVASGPHAQLRGSSPHYQEMHFDP